MTIRACWSLLCLLPFAADALQVHTLVISRDQTVYHVVVDALIDAPSARVRAQLLDIQSLARLDPSVRDVRASDEADGQRVESKLEECLFGFCRTLVHVQLVQASGNEITAQTLAVPGSSFKSGVARWQLTPQGQGTRLLFTADTEPDLWIPPFIGPPALMRQLEAKTRASLHTLEQLSRE